MDPLATNGEVRSEINVTPFVDVMLVLLVIFMVVTPLLRLKIPIELPLARTSEGGEAPRHQVTVSIDAGGALRVNDQAVARERLGEVLRAALSAQREHVVFLEADRSRSYAEIVDVMDAARAAGVQRIGVVTQRRASK